jgi:hypothetical protein
MGPMGHPVGVHPVLLADKGIFTATMRAPLPMSSTIWTMQALFSFELAIIGLAFAAVFVLVLVLLAQFDRRRPGAGR